MSIYTELLILSAVVCWVVDVSGWTDSWLGWLSKFTARYGRGPVRELKPFSCSQCMVWWCGLVWCAVRGRFDLAGVGACAGFALASMTISQLLIFIREAGNALLAWLFKCIEGDK